ncbi:ECF transporter S component [Ruminococcaceae bacterium OttesenSCG-928-A16]|nr:ECF transporter S component [Ruminococcaceae bacterium OttesenSCG-928-A16]
MQTNSRRSIRNLTQFSLLLAIEIVLGVTPLGLITLPVASITLLHVPVIIGAVVMGPLKGGVLGGTFGIIALIKASTAAVGPVDILFSPFLSGNPVASLIMCLVPRILLGVFAALLFRLFKNRFKNNVWGIGITAALSTALHTVMVLGCLFFLFSAIPLAAVFTTLISLNGVLEILAAVIIAVPVCKALLSYNEKNK